MKPTVERIPGLYGEPEASGSWLTRFAWIVAGFNLGFIVPAVIVFFVLPVLLPDFGFRRGSDNDSREIGVQPEQEVSYVVVTSVPSNTPSPTATLRPTEPPPTVSSASEAQIADTVPTEAVAVQPTATEFPTATSIPPTAAPLPAPVSYDLSGFDFEQQTWNNCGPANLAMGLSFYGWHGSQRETATFLKPDREDKNVSPDQMVTYVTENTNLNALYRVGGSLETLRQLVSKEFVVIVESGYQPPGDDWYGHYLTVVGYDDNLSEFYFYDSFLGRPVNPRVAHKDRDFDGDWQSFNRTYIVVYPDAREQELRAVLGRDWNPNANWGATAELARQEAAAEPDNAFAWFNLGTTLTQLGDYENASRAFDQAFNIGLPWRMMWYQFGPYEAYYQSSRLDDVVALAQSTIKTTPFVEETYYFLGRVDEVRGNRDEALSNYLTALRFNPNFRAADVAAERLKNA